ncbi:MAG: thiol reductant ABC exporter subunit CydD [Sulfobacillus acidophilus]|uniref:Thiol reductant ABC exporter subunit CydD n=1 Tax=Sulfobacillus acidophilus TaxID=53633 RepID=A0A2T2WGX3_9FIRM|nr:MAG: thiol reductant ABC exporter subunit CydD [Sulfobacillus acidophilus]
MDVRLWKQLYAAKPLAIGLGTGGILTGILIVIQATLLSRIVTLGYLDHVPLKIVWPLAWVLLAVIAIRAAIAGVQENWALRHAAQIESDLRQKFFDHLIDRGPMAPRLDSGELISLAVQGIDDLEVFLARYFPQIIITAAVPAVAWIGVVVHDWISGLILLVTLPLIPLFMILIGRQAENHSQRQINLMNRLSGHFLDVLHGLVTLKLFGQSRAQSQTVYKQSEAFRATTMTTLRIAFLSGMVLELIASLSMAFVAVAVGLRLIHADISFETAFMVLVLVPEFYIPWRNLGARFHDGLKGASAAKEIFDLMESSSPALGGGSLVLSGPGPWPIVWNDVSFTYPGRSQETLSHLSFRIDPGEHVAIVGPSGSGKSTFVQLLLGASTFSGSIRVADTSLVDLDLAWWRKQMSWVTQHPYLFEGSVLDNLQRAAPQASFDDIEQALTAAGAFDFVQELPQGWNTDLGQEAFRLSGGQRQRLALARAFLMDTPVVIFDEPTQNLDLASERVLLGGLERLSHRRTTITIAHRLATIMRADRVLVLHQGHLAQWGSPAELRKAPGIYRSLLQAYLGKEPGDEADPINQIL